MQKTLFYLLLLMSSVGWAQKENYTLLNYTCSDHKERPFVVYTPENVNLKESKPLLVFLHGAISSPKLKADPLAYIKKSPLVELANKGEFYLMFCYGQKGATWFDTVGVDMIMGEIQAAQKQFNIDANKIFVSGFSDGGSGVLYLAMNQASSFAGFLAMNGSLKVAEQLGYYPLFPENMNNKPLYIINTDKDMLYPISQILPTVDYLKQYNNQIIFKQVKGNHEMGYLKDESASIIDFIQKNSLSPAQEYSWECTDLGNNTLGFMTIETINKEAQATNWHSPYYLKVLNDKAYWGLKYDYTYQGEGMKVKGFKNDTCTARRMGVEKGDIILTMEKDSLTSPYSAFFYKAKKKAGEPTALSLLRNDSLVQLKGHFNKGYYYSVLKCKEPTAKVQADIQKTTLRIKTSKVSTLSLDIYRLKEMGIKTILCNGKKYKLKKLTRQKGIINI